MDFAPVRAAAAPPCSDGPRTAKSIRGPRDFAPVRARLRRLAPMGLGPRSQFAVLAISPPCAAAAPPCSDGPRTAKVIRGPRDFARARRHAFGFSWWPPNSKRIAESTRSWNSASPRDAKRSRSAAARTCAGTASSIAASSVQRPSPESDTCPEKPSSDGSWASARAVRSRSHDATTLPRRQTSVTSARSKSY